MERQRLNEEQFWELYAVSQPHLVRFARRLCSDRMLAEDAVADAFVSVLKTIRKDGDSGPTRETFISYMRVCVRHEVARLSRRLSVEETNTDVEAQLEGQQLVEHVDDRLNDVEVWDGDVAKRALDALSDRDRALLLLTEVEKRPLAEVAQSQGMTAQAVAAATYRARDALRTNYLIEAVSEEPSCPKMRVDFLAAFARGKAPSVRRRKIEAHLDECERCPGRLRKMISYRVPVAAVALLASVGGVVASGNASAPLRPWTPVNSKLRRQRFLVRLGSEVLHSLVAELYCCCSQVWWLGCCLLRFLVQRGRRQAVRGRAWWARAPLMLETRQQRKIPTLLTIRVRPAILPATAPTVFPTATATEMTNKRTTKKTMVFRRGAVGGLVDPTLKLRRGRSRCKAAVGR
ncbi:sigma-70 family RNA polymerase sigma factor [Leucobacter coleopterorum]|uniref:Sigma-70 family RNA polymerase sigma factor n=1 Tax=Leucobacter coleopterorum TaxID=2714933 RepID=A0ABX6JU74_9MICO|nr:sigma-70 family RNA polymerase sigma factor [Leucobacter coleopterorum]